MTFMNMENLIGLNLLNDTSVYNDKLYSYASDSEGD